MNSQSVVTQNWLTQKLSERAYLSSLIFNIILVVFSYVFLNSQWQADQWMAASYDNVFEKREYWRLWSTLFAHADIGHLLSNLMLLIPLSVLLSGYFGLMVFPVIGVIMGGLINYIVLQSLPVSVNLIGISGLVYWMGAFWLTLFIILDRRKSLRRRMAISLFLTVVLFIPESFRPEISYLSHFVGYLLGIISAIILYYFRRNEFEMAEVREVVYEIEPEGVIESPSVAPHPK